MSSPARRVLQAARLLLPACAIALIAVAPAHAQQRSYIGTVRLIDVHPHPASYWALDQGPRVTRLAPEGIALAPLNGTRVQISGELRHGSLVVRRSSIRVLPSPQHVRASSAKHTTAVVLIKVGTLDPPTRTRVMQQVFGVNPPDPYTVKQYWSTQTYGRVNLGGVKNPAGDVFGPYVVSGDPNSCDFGNWDQQATNAGAHDGFDPNNYQSIIWLNSGNCGYSGEEPGSQVWISGYSEPPRYAISHELGHNFGNPHASTLRCYTDQSHTVVTTLSNFCDAPDEYGDPFDPMGRGGTYPNCQVQSDGGSIPYEMEPWRKLNIGVMSLADAPTTNIAGTHTFTIAPVEQASGVRMLRLPDGRGDDRMFDLSFRQPIGLFDQWYDRPLDANNDGNRNALNGVAVTMDSRLIASQSRIALPNSYLLDLTPNTSGGGSNPCDPNSHPTGFEDAPLPNGQSWSDPYTGLTLTVDSVGPNGAQVTVTYGAGTVDVSTPTAPGALHAAVARNRTVTLSWSPATDTVYGVRGYIVLRDGKAIKTVSGSHTTDNPGPGAHSYTVAAADSKGNVGPRSRPITVTVPGSKPPPACVVPNLAGLSLADAKTALRRARCKLGTVEQKHSRRVRKGRVMSQSPAAHRRKRLGTKVNIVISSG